MQFGNSFYQIALDDATGAIMSYSLGGEEYAQGGMPLIKMRLLRNSETGWAFTGCWADRSEPPGRTIRPVPTARFHV